MNRLSFACWISLGLGCAPSATPQRAVTASTVGSAPHSTSPHGDVRAPVVVRWVVVSAPEGTPPAQSPIHHRLRARIEQPGGLGLPLRITVEVPRGATLTLGQPQFSVQPGVPGSAQEFEYDIQTLGTPTDDLVLLADASSDAAGVHAEARYRFGRPPPVAPTPALTATTLTVGGAALGQGVQMSP